MGKKSRVPYEIRFIDEAVEDAKLFLTKNERNALMAEIKRVLLRDPRGCSEELVLEPLAGFRSFHHGKHRTVFRLYGQERKIVVVGIGKKHPPDSVYERLEKLATTGKLADTILTTLRLYGHGR